MEWLEGEDLAERLRGAAADHRARASTLGRARRRGARRARTRAASFTATSSRATCSCPAATSTRVKVLDFGIARDCSTPRARSRAPARRIGTPGYMAPEQARGERELDARADVFSLGCVLFECLTGAAAVHRRDGDGGAREDPASRRRRALARRSARGCPPRSTSSSRACSPRSPRRAPARRPRGRGGARRDRRAARSDVARLAGRSTTRGRDRRAHADHRRAAAGLRRARDRPRRATGGRSRRRRSPTAPTPGAERHARRDRCCRTARSTKPTSSAARHAVPYGARVDRLLDGSLVVTLAGRGAATDQAAHAARCALALRAIAARASRWRSRPGAAVISASAPVGELIDRAARCCVRGDAEARRRSASTRSTAGLLDARFEVERRRARPRYLRASATSPTRARTLLGKPTPCVGRERELGAARRDVRRVRRRAGGARRAGDRAGGRRQVARCATSSLARLARATAPSVEVWIGARRPDARRLAVRRCWRQALRARRGIVDGEPRRAPRRSCARACSRHARAADAARDRRVPRRAGRRAASRRGTSPCSCAPRAATRG